MIEADLLRQLGWSEDLIEEVTRVAETIQRDAPSDNSMMAPPNYPHYQSGNTLFVDATLLQAPVMPSIRRAKKAR